jgi:phage FluMu protein Com
MQTKTVFVKVRCPVCGKWLMSKDFNASGKVEVFCKRCKKPLVIDLSEKPKVSL